MINQERNFLKTRTVIFRIIIIVCLAIFAGGVSLAGDSTNVPTVFSTKIGGMLGSYSVQLKDGVLVYSAESHSRETDSAKTIPSDAQWREFFNTLDELKAWQWSPRYINKDIMDGGYWELEIQLQGRSLKISGLNSYPQADGKPGEYSEAFRKYLKAVEKLLGGKRFT